MPPGEQADDGQLDRLLLADDDIAQLGDELGDPVSHEGGVFRQRTIRSWIGH